MNSKEFRRLTADLARAAAPTAPRCPHAEQCGGCAFQDREYTGQVAAKREALVRIFSAAALFSDLVRAADFSVIASPDAYNYRTRMDYVATKGRFGLRARGKFNYIVELETCHLIPPAAFAAAKAVWLRAGELGLPDYNIRSHEGFLRYVVVRRSPDDEFLLAAVTAAGERDAEMAQLAATALAQPGVVGFHWLRNASLTDISFGAPVRHWGAERLTMITPSATLEVGPNTFFQNNVHVLSALLDDLRLAVMGEERATRDDRQALAIADLYGGVGTIGLHLAAEVASVVCVEAVAESAALAERNILLNEASNIVAVAEDVLAWLRRQQPGGFAVAVADPPRIGLGPEVCAELLRLGPQRIVYVSCNPLTQIADLGVLGAGYELRSLRGYDMFPHTPHVETLAVLERRGAP